MKLKRPTAFLSLAAPGLAVALALMACGVSTGSEAPILTSPPPATAAVEQASAPPADGTAPTEPAAEPGTSPMNPAARGETITSAGWEFTVLEVLTGDEAQAKLKAASSFNKPPADSNLEYVVVRVHARYVGASTGTQRIDASFFSSAGGDGTEYKKPKITEVTNPSPFVQGELLTGQEVEGWVTVLSAKGDAGLLLVIQPRDNGLSTGPQDLRYISLAQ